MILKVKRMAVVGLGALMSLAIGCNSSSEPLVKPSDTQVKEKKQLVKSMTQVHTELLEANLQIQRSISAMKDFTRSSDLKKSSAMFDDSVTELKAAADHARARGAEMRERRMEYLERWQAEVATMQNADLKEELEARRERIRKNFDKITTMADEVRAAYPPYVSNLEQIQKALKLELSPTGIATIKPTLDSTIAQAEALAKKVDALGVEVDALSGKLAPTPTPAAPK